MVPNSKTASIFFCDLIDQILNSGEKRLARTLLLLAMASRASLRKWSPSIGADSGGNDRDDALRSHFFTNKFRKLGFIRYNGGLHIDSSLLSVVLHESEH